MRFKGKIATWNDDKGFGFITPFDGGDRVFVHMKAFSNPSRRPEAQEVVTYSIAQDKQGRTRAVNAVLAGDGLQRKTKKTAARSASLIAVLFLAGVGISVSADKLPLLILGAYLLMSAITFLMYAVDKSAAKTGDWRTSEETLQFLALAGGWPGALVAQQTLRHKYKKASFRAVFRATVLLNCAGLAWLHTSDGQALLAAINGASS